MPESLNNKLIVAISSQALFDLTESNGIFESKGIDYYATYQRENEHITLDPGPGFALIKKLLDLNKRVPCVEVILMSRNSSDTGLRVFRSIEKHKLAITRAVFTSGRNPYRYARAFNAHLFLSTNPGDVSQALQSGLAAATMIPHSYHNTEQSTELRIAFDGDAVIFSGESEAIFKEQGLEAFHNNERDRANHPLENGPFYPFLKMLQTVQQTFDSDQCPIRTALITARQAPAHTRVIHTLREWNLRIDECLFLGGIEKTDALRAFNADIFFDDHWMHCERASAHVPSAHVPFSPVSDSEG